MESAHFSDDERSVAADSWSVRSEYGSTLDGGDDLRHSDSVSVRPSDYDTSDKEDADVEELESSSMLGLRSHWDSAYADELVNFHDHGDAGEVWFGEDVMETVASWTQSICLALSSGNGQDTAEKGSNGAEASRIEESISAGNGLVMPEKGSYGGEVSTVQQSSGSAGNGVVSAEKECNGGEASSLQQSVSSVLSAGNGLVEGEKGCNGEEGSKIEQLLKDWNVLDIGTGNGVLLHLLSRQGFTDVTGTDYSEGAVELAKAVCDREGFSNINFVVDDVLDSKLDRKFRLITDKGTFDAIGLHPDGAARRLTYWREVTRLLQPGGVLVITSCNSTKNELVEEANAYARTTDGRSSKEQLDIATRGEGSILQYLDHVRTYPTFIFGGVEGNRVCTVAFMLKE